MAPWNATTTEPSPSATAGPPNPTTLDAESQKRNHFEGRTVTGIIFALACFVLITSVFISNKRRRDALRHQDWHWLGKLKRLVPCLRPPIQPDTTHGSISRQPTFAGTDPVSRASTYDQHLPEYSKHDPLGHQDTPRRCSPIGEVSGESQSVLAHD